MLHWKDLTKKEKEKFKGCGPGKVIFFVPQFIFKASCQQHDFYYWRGGNLIDKSKADAYFYVFMLEDIQRKRKHRWFFWIVATKYYVFVTLFGHGFFSYGKKRGKVEFKKIGKKSTN